MAFSQDSVTEHFGCVLEVSHISHLEARLQHTIALNKLLETVTNGIASTANSKNREELMSGS